MMASVPSKLDWYFDFVSPFAYLQLEQFDKLPPQTRVTLKPVVLGALLSHWHTRGPAEIPGKRRWTYRYALFRAQQLGVPFRMPPAHPFNPIRLLRLAVLLNGEVGAVREIFRFIWRDGIAPDSPDGWIDLCHRLEVKPTEADLSEAGVKLALRANTDEALSREVFGVPTFAWGSELFWGEDAMPLLQTCLADPGWLRSDEVVRVSALPTGIARSV